MDDNQSLGFIAVFIGGSLLMVFLQLHAPPSLLRTLAMVAITAGVVLVPPISVFTDFDPLATIGRGTAGVLEAVWAGLLVLGGLVWLAAISYSVSVGWHLAGALFK